MGKLLNYPELKHLKGIRYTRQHLKALENLGRFPRRIKIGPNVVAWDEAEIDAHLHAQKAARDAPPPPPPVRRRVRRQA